MVAENDPLAGFGLIGTEANPIPEGAHLVRIESARRLPLRAAWWEASAPSKGTVCILQGRAEFIEKYFEVVGELRQRGFAVVAFDWRGQGASGREIGNRRKGHVANFNRYGHDLAAVTSQLLAMLPKPHFALAHSMGAAIALREAQAGRFPFSRLMALSPMMDLCLVKRPRAVARLVRGLWSMGLSRSFVPGGSGHSISTLPFAGNRLTSDPARYARNAEVAMAVGERAVGAPTIGWLHSAFRAMAPFRDPRWAASIPVPTLILAGGADPVCATPVAERFAAYSRSASAIVIPGARHELLMERDSVRAQVWAAFDAFIPGTSPADLVEPSAVEQRQDLGMEPAIAGGHD